MPTYSYIAKTIKGETVSGTVDAKDKLDAARELRGQGLIPLTFEETRGGGKGGGRGGLEQILRFDMGAVLDSLRGVPLKEKVMFSRHLGVMISSGVPITRALKVLAKQSKNAAFRNAILRVEEDIRKGTRLADAFAKHPKVFNNLYVSMVRSGDTAGNLTEVLELLAEQLKKEHDLRSRIRGALMYPAVIVTAMGGIGALMMVMVVPKIGAIFKDLDAELPVLTRFVIQVSEILTRYWLFILLSLPFILYILKKAAGTKRGKTFLSWVLLKFPLFSGITRQINSARFARTLASLISGGVPILEALVITRDTLGNVYYQKSMDRMYEEVRAGKSLFEAIAKFENIYPGLIVQMVRVGEETGALSGVLKRIAEFFEEEVDNATKNLSSIIEPILMLVIGAVVGIFAVSMIQPMYEMMGNI